MRVYADIVFFVKQKTAYELRISDWSSDVCSSDLMLLAGACVAPAGAQQAQGVVSLGGTVTEIVYDLGEGDRLVADDLSSLYPKEATLLPRVGYYRAVPLECVLSLRPDLLLASENAGPHSVLDRIRAQMGRAS